MCHYGHHLQTKIINKHHRENIAKPITACEKWASIWGRFIFVIHFKVRVLNKNRYYANLYILKAIYIVNTKFFFVKPFTGNVRQPKALNTS